ncbi:hypothetical protein MRB53_037245 [Persea americana]|nr:hypothetical protein MRB53_037245 [Persea americana]
MLLGWSNLFIRGPCALPSCISLALLFLERLGIFASIEDGGSGETVGTTMREDQRNRGSSPELEKQLVNSISLLNLRMANQEVGLAIQVSTKQFECTEHTCIHVVKHRSCLITCLFVVLASFPREQCVDHATQSYYLLNSQACNSFFSLQITTIHSAPAPPPPPQEEQQQQQQQQQTSVASPPPFESSIVDRRTAVDQAFAAFERAADEAISLLDSIVEE